MSDSGHASGDGTPGELREAEVALRETDFDAMGIERLLDLYREAGIRDLEELLCRGDGAVVRVTVDDRVDEGTLSALDCVDGWEYVSGSTEPHVYLVEFTSPRLPGRLTDEAEDLFGTCDPEVREGRVTMSLVGAQASISEAVDEYRSVGATPDLRKLARYEGTADPLDALTDRQREVLRTAYEVGHYEVPSEASVEDVAGELALDPSTVAEHLQRAERNLLRQQFE